MGFKKVRIWAISGLILTAPVAMAATEQVAETATEMVIVKPAGLQGPLTNPGIGVASFHDGYGERLTAEQYPDTGIEYQRFYWRDLEPQEGKYNFALVDQAFAVAARHRPAMNVGLRFMALEDPASGSRIPDWLIKKGIKGTWTPDGKTFVPDLDDGMFIKYAQKLLAAFGKRYDGNPELAYVDIGLVGSWGEWHNSNFPTLPPLAQRYTTAQLNRYVDMHFDAFPHTPKIMLISGGETLAYAAKRGAGWRADCWGDWHNFTPDWSHMRDDYPQRLAAANQAWSGFDNAWQKAPVSLEICGYMAEWQSVQHYTRQQVQDTYDWALAHHASTLNLKSRAIPAEYRDIVDKALETLGYRFRMVALTHQRSLYSGQKIILNSHWQNDGVAPIYLRYWLAYRLVNDSGQAVLQGVTPDDIRTWLPGEHESDFTLATRSDFAPGHYWLEVALVNDQKQPRINLSNDGKRADGWYRLSSITVKSRDTYGK